MFQGLKRIVGGGRTEEERPIAAPIDEALDLLVSAYTDDCLVRGRLRLDADRLTDMLNAQSSIMLRDAVAIALDDGRQVVVETLEVARDELVALAAAGPRGSAARRVHTRRHPALMQCGPYRFWGYLHAPAGTDPLARLRHRPPMVPMTDVRAEYTLGGRQIIERLPGLIVNRDLAQTIAAALDSDIHPETAPLAALYRRRPPTATPDDSATLTRQSGAPNGESTPNPPVPVGTGDAGDSIGPARRNILTDQLVELNGLALVTLRGGAGSHPRRPT